MNFTFLVIFLLLTLAITYKTLKISNKQLTLIVLVLFIILVSYNVKEKFQVQTSSTSENQTSSSTTGNQTSSSTTENQTSSSTTENQTSSSSTENQTPSSTGNQTSSSTGNRTSSSSNIDSLDSLVLDNMDGNVTEELKSTYLEQAQDLVTISNDLGIYDIKDTEYLSELVKKLQGLQVVGAKFHFFGTNLTRLAGFNNLTRVSNFINTDLTDDGGVVARNYEWYSNTVRTHVKFAVSRNDLLTNINGFNSLINTNFIFITRNNQLKTIEGFSSIRKINEIYISRNDSLESVKGFENLEIIDGHLILDIINLKELQPFTKLKTVTRGVALLGELFNDPDFDIDYYFPELTSTGILLSHNMSGNLLTKFRARPGFIESETPSPRALTLDNNNQTSSSTSTELVEEDPRFFLMDSPESINNYLNLLNMNKSKPKLVNGNIYAEALDSHKKVNIYAEALDSHKKVK